MGRKTEKLLPCAMLAVGRRCNTNLWNKKYKGNSSFFTTVSILFKCIYNYSCHKQNCHGEEKIIKWKKGDCLT